MTPAARRRLAVLRGLIGAVAVSVVAWVVVDGWGVVLLAGSLFALAAYCALLASVRQEPGRRDRRTTAGQVSGTGHRSERMVTGANGAGPTTPEADRVARGA